MISDEFNYNYGGSASLNMRTIDHLMNRALLAFLDSFFKLKSPNKFGINVGLNMLINISTGFLHNRQKIWRIFNAFSNFTHGKSPLALSRPYIFSDHFDMWQGHSLP